MSMLLLLKKLSLLQFNYKKKLLTRISFTAFFIIAIFSQNSLAWSGYDQENNTSIEIGPGNLVREGLTITIYDWNTDKHHDVDVIFLEDSFNGTRIEVYDRETKKKRVFEMTN